MTEDILYQDQLGGGCHWSLLMRRGTVLRLTDLEGGANVGMLFYNPNNPLERYNAPDTLKCQHTFKLHQGHCLYSDMGRIFCSIITDTVGWHDTVCGNANAQLVRERWGERRYQQYRNDWQRNGYDSFLVELAKYGLGRKDMAANVNFFSKVAVADNGDLHYVGGHSMAGDHVELRFEMDTLVLLHTCPHPLNPAPEYPRKAIGYTIRRAAPVAANDACRTLCAENTRGFTNIQLYHLGCGHD
ncbi:MAG: urea amidolyase associated protein UAAP1 [Pseudomonadota bacterium]